MICIIGAIKEEISGIKQHIAIKKKYCVGSATFYQGVYKKKEIIIVRSGIGQSCAYKAISEAAEMFPFRYIISIGFAGGVTPELKVSDLLLSDKIYFCDDEESLFHFNKVPLFPVAGLYNHGNKIKKVLNKCKIKHKYGNIISINKVAESAKFKEWLGKNYPVLGVEMETASIAKVAEHKKVFFVSLRAISDEVFHSVIQVSRYINKKGEVNKLKAGLYMLKHPSLIPDALELKNNCSKAARVLTQAVLKIIDCGDDIK